MSKYIKLSDVMYAEFVNDIGIHLIEVGEDCVVIDKSTLKEYIWQLLNCFGSGGLTPQDINEITESWTGNIIEDCNEIIPIRTSYSEIMKEGKRRTENEENK